ncbi:MAG: hypothetical protein QXW00_01445 [Candidatus Woesearchaeota archaeon]
MDAEAGRRLKTLGLVTYILAVVTVFSLAVVHVFGIMRLNSDKFSFFLISLLVLLLLLPIVTYIKFFNIVEVRRDTRIMEKKQG